MTVMGRKAPQPHECNACQLSHTHGLASSAFARHYSRNHMLFSLPVGTEMFHFPTFPPHTLYIQVRVTRHHSCWVSPFGNPRITARLTAPRGISQPPTSFIGSWCQDIHRTLINTYNKDARVHCAVLKQHTTTPTARKTHFLVSQIIVAEKTHHVFPQDPTAHRYNHRDQEQCPRRIR